MSLGMGVDTGARLASLTAIDCVAVETGRSITAASEPSTAEASAGGSEGCALRKSLYEKEASRPAR